jgi:hypothetical protein
VSKKLYASDLKKGLSSCYSHSFFVTIQPMPLRVRKPLAGVILRSKIGVETITIHPKIDIPDKGISRKRLGSSESAALKDESS